MMEQTLHDPALPVMTMDLLSNVLGRADHPGEVGSYVAEEIRALTGVRAVFFVQYQDLAQSVEYRLVSVNPERLRRFAESTAFRRLCETAHDLNAMELWRPDDLSDEGAILRREGFGASMVIPLAVGAHRVGAALLLGFPDEALLNPTRKLLATLSTVLALVLRNAFLYKQQKRIIGERTAELRQANARLRAELAERERLQDELRQSEERLKLATEAGRLGVWDWNVRENRMHWDERMLNMYGASPDWLASGVNVWERGLHPDDRERALEECAAALRGDKDFNTEFRVLRPDGMVVWIKANALVVRDEVGNAVRMTGSNQDITERKWAESELSQANARLRAELAERERLQDELRQSEERLQLATEAGRLGIWDWNVRENRMLWDQRMLEMYGASPDWLAGGVNAWERSLHPDDRKHAFDECAAALRGERDFNTEFRVLRPDGAIVWIRANALVIRDAAGNAVRMTGLNQDVTERKQAESELQTYRDQLEALVSERTAQLEHAKDQAEAANHAKSVFLANMSHELRTPLNAIIGFSDLMQIEARAGRAQLSSGQAENLSLIHKSAEHLLRLINDVLAISKIEAGRAEYQPGACDLRALLTEMRELFRERATHKRLSLQVQSGESVPHHVCTDATKLRQVLINLLGNAIKFTAQGGVLLEVSDLGAGRAGHRRLRFMVADTGPGIGAEEQARLFQPFAQTCTGLSSREGTGLGLAISRQYVQLLGGDIEVASTRGNGSRFSFELELEVLPDIEKPPEAKRTVIGLKPGQPTYRVLVIDDIDTNRRLLVEYLAPLGFELTEASDGEAALACWREGQPDLILLDMRMPKLDGYEVARHIRAEETDRHTLIIAVTASAFVEQRADVLAAGCDDFLPKPFREANLFQMLGKHLGLQYRFAENVADTPAAPVVTFDARRLAALPETLLDRLRDALLRLDLADAQAAAQAASAADPELGAWLAAEMREMRFEPLLDLCEHALVPTKNAR